MSFILDALRKSENARQRHGGPALAEVPIARRREGKPWWIAGVIVLLVVNLGALLFVLLGNREPETAAPATVAQAPVPVAVEPAAQPAQAQVAQPAPPPAAPAPAPTPAAPSSTSRSLADEAAVTAPFPVDPDAPSPSATTAANVPDRAPIVRAVTPGSAAGSAAVEGPDESLPTLNELTGERAANMPPMHIDIHVYSTNPTERFVFINMRKYVEGATLTEGPVLERIRSDGVVLNQRGFRFILPRQ